METSAVALPARTEVDVRESTSHDHPYSCPSQSCPAKVQSILKNMESLKAEIVKLQQEIAQVKAKQKSMTIDDIKDDETKVTWNFILILFFTGNIIMNKYCSL